MGKSKDMFIQMMEEFFSGNPFMDMFSNTERSVDKELNTTSETAEYTKGNYKTKIITTFDESGAVISTFTHSEFLGKPKPSLEELRAELSKAVEKEDYDRAAELQKEIKSYETNKNT